MLSAVDDPFLPPSVLEQVRREVAETPAVEIEFPARGGHVGFTSYLGPFTPWYYGEWRAAEFLQQTMEQRRTAI